MIAECLRRRSAGVGDETLFAWMLGEGYDEMESLSMLAEALGWTVSRILGEHISELLPALTDKIVARRNEGTRVRLSQIPRRLFHL